MDGCKRKNKVLLSGGQGKPNSLNLYLLLRDHQNRSVSCSLLPASLSAQCLTASAKLGAFHCALMSRSHFSECLVSWDNLEMLNKFLQITKTCLPMQDARLSVIIVVKPSRQYKKVNKMNQWVEEIKQKCERKPSKQRVNTFNDMQHSISFQSQLLHSKAFNRRESQRQINRKLNKQHGAD